MKILQIDTPITWRGGEQQLLYLAIGLKKRGHSQIIVGQPDSVLLKRCQQEQLQIKPIKMRGEWDLSAVWKLARLIDQESMQIVHPHSSHSHALGLMAAKLSKSKPKVIVSRRVDFHIQKNPFSQFKYKKGITKIITSSSRIKAILIEDSVPEEKIEVIYEGIDLNRFKKVKNSGYLYHELGLQEKNPIVGIIAALAPHKDHSNFLQAASLVKRDMPLVQFLIVGEGPLKNILMDLTHKLNLQDNVRFTGFRTDVSQILSVLDVFVISSYLEGLCTSILDAQSYGVPVVATNTGGIPEIIYNGINGLLVPPRNPQALAEAIIRLLKNKALASQLADKAQETVKNFDKEIMIEKTEQFYYQILGNK